MGTIKAALITNCAKRYYSLVCADKDYVYIMLQVCYLNASMDNPVLLSGVNIETSKLHNDRPHPQFHSKTFGWKDFVFHLSLLEFSLEMR